MNNYNTIDIFKLLQDPNLAPIIQKFLENIKENKVDDVVYIEVNGQQINLNDKDLWKDVFENNE